jgi:hypothetical protein
MRGKYPLIVRTVDCAEQEFEDEFYRLLLYYRDRRSADGHETGSALTRFLVVGEGLTKERAGEIVKETTGGDVPSLDAEDLGLFLPGRDLSFDVIAAPAGLATLSF